MGFWDLANQAFGRQQELGSNQLRTNPCEPEDVGPIVTNSQIKETQELPALKSVKECPKCDCPTDVPGDCAGYEYLATDVGRVLNIKHPMGFDPTVVGEAMIRTCVMCGYEWAESCAS